MKPLERSVIKKINVKIGDIVKKDQILITFDPAFNNAEAERLKNEMFALTAQLNRLRSEFQQKPYAGGTNQFEKWQLAIYKQRQEYYRERMNYFKEALSQIAASRKSKQDNLVKQRERLAAIKQLEGMFKELHGKKAASLKDLLQMSVTRMEMEATVDQIENDLLELNHRRGTLLAERNSFIQEWRNGLSEEMVTADRNLTATVKNYDKVARLIEYVYLRAPCDAVVHEIASFSPGSAVQEAEALITLIPLDGNIELETEIRTQDIGKVAQGAQARVKLTAYPFQKHGTLNGLVRNISENTLQKNIQGQELTYYRGRVTVSGKLKGVKDSFRLIPGMEAQCEIKCGRRRVIEFVLHPLIKALDETAREP
jgi:HlyD family secretion protein